MVEWLPEFDDAHRHHPVPDYSKLIRFTDICIDDIDCVVTVLMHKTGMSENFICQLLWLHFREVMPSEIQTYIQLRF